MCQMCDEYENELMRMGLVEDARKFREERQAEEAAARDAKSIGEAATTAVTERQD